MYRGKKSEREMIICNGISKVIIVSGKRVSSCRSGLYRAVPSKLIRQVINVMLLFWSRAFPKQNKIEKKETDRRIRTKEPGYVIIN